jgi:xanthine phosphoribosyltransferase
MTVAHKEYHVSWDKIYTDAMALSKELSVKGPFKGMVAITRGGLLPACIVANYLNIKRIETFGLCSYDHDQQATHSDARSTVEVTKELDLAGDGTGWLVIDDLVDTGGTLEVVRQKLPNAVYGVVYAKPNGEDKADHFVEKIEQETWVFFPWENYE